MMLAEEVNELWKWPNFLLLAGLLGYLIKKHGGPFLTARSEQIRQNLEAGEKAKKEAEALAAGVQAKIANLDREIAQLRESAKADLDREAQRLRHDAETEMSRIEKHTEAEIVSLGKNARMELRQYAAELALDLAETKVRERMTPTVQSTLLGNFAGDMAGKPSGEAAGRSGTQAL